MKRIRVPSSENVGASTPSALEQEWIADELWYLARRPAISKETFMSTVTSLLRGYARTVVSSGSPPITADS